MGNSEISNLDGPSVFTVAAAQMTSKADITENLAAARRLAEQAAAQGASLFLLPECFAFIGHTEQDKFAIAEPLDHGNPGPIVTTLTAMAQELNLWVIAGGVAITHTPDRTFNSCLVISPDGEVAARYDKVHLFDVDIPDGPTLCESQTTQGGNQLVCVETPLCRIGLSICYDLRFPELYRDLVLKHDAQVLVVPAAFTSHTGRAHWHPLLRARAIENQCYVIAAGQTGQHNEKRSSYGHSMVIDPWGTIIAQQGEEVGIITATVDLHHQQEVRARMPCRDHTVLIEK